MTEMQEMQRFFTSMDPTEEKDRTVMDISPYNPCPCCITLSHTLTLGKDEMHFEITNVSCFGDKQNVVQQRPYGQLGSVSISKACCCFWMASIDEIAMVPGCGCDQAKVEEVGNLLNDRKIKRGNIQQNVLHDEIRMKLDTLSAMVGDVGKSRNLPLQPALSAVPIPRFTTKDYDVTFKPSDCCSGCLTNCGYFKTTLTMEPEEVMKTDLNCCSQTSQRRPYAQLGSVSVVDNTRCCQYNFCGGCQRIGGEGVAIDSWVVYPGWGTSTSLVKEIQEELQNRKVCRGSIAQLASAERTKEIVDILQTNVQMIMKDMKCI